MKSHTSGFHSLAHFGRGACGNREANQGPASHCCWYLFGKVDPRATTPVVPLLASPCGHAHLGTCDLCEELALFPVYLENWVTDVMNQRGIFINTNDTQVTRKRKTPDISLHDISPKSPVEIFMRLADNDLKYYISRYIHYYGHQARLCNESAN